jgi:hypothetical protein
MSDETYRLAPQPGMKVVVRRGTQKRIGRGHANRGRANNRSVDTIGLGRTASMQRKP